MNVVESGVFGPCQVVTKETRSTIELATLPCPETSVKSLSLSVSHKYPSRPLREQSFITSSRQTFKYHRQDSSPCTHMQSAIGAKHHAYRLQAADHQRRFPGCVQVHRRLYYWCIFRSLT